MDAKRHAWLARRLIERCGGLRQAATLCRLNFSRLSDFQNPNVEGGFMPADVIADLEAYCGQPVYSQALIDHCPGGVAAGAVLDEACDTVEAAAALMAAARAAAADGRLSRAERDRLEQLMTRLEAEARQLRVALEGGGIEGGGA